MHCISNMVFRKKVYEHPFIVQFLTDWIVKNAGEDYHDNGLVTQIYGKTFLKEIVTKSK